MQTIKYFFSALREYWSWWVVVDWALAATWFVQYGFTLDFDHFLIGLLMLTMGMGQLALNASEGYSELLESQIEELVAEQ
ncbi:hypothetical protein PBI_LUCKY2013_107 [Mycobacterium phage Lucky2013]|uniref:Uncharacterized protein n=2 Tax=Omegavirus courthouse TaxID=1089119 RepID=G8I5G2_9CAUD|nr:hypothetical protein CM09_gp105 [Mycobacterium phage Courthouse]YP_009205240.1 hypothetical protein AVT17_gp110 [Mycobacterium phage Ariel]YP_009213327.1 hypothetical protein AVV70_gp110 [Mycobacterium phage MiaZeal]ASD53500.1 hypothetical protein PBI_LUCKY2013_107 [Mycobacterium phage Lucky2013]ASZ74184.1 hypothetical protein SEA_SQUINT_108 [Mycobacterium phage Squint]ATS92949.1 hypothetical protein SEA_SUPERPHIKIMAN_107 [Mycobacterium phage Superphikiman]AER47956.1 hypothetical protein C